MSKLHTSLYTCVEHSVSQLRVCLSAEGAKNVYIYIYIYIYYILYIIYIVIIIILLYYHLIHKKECLYLAHKKMNSILNFL